MTDGHGSGLRAFGRACVGRLDPRDTRGVTLVEMVIAIVILGLVSTSMIGALFTVTATSSQQQSSSISEAEGRRIAEYVRATVPYQPCAINTDYNASLTAANIGTVDGGVSAAVTNVSYWNGLSFTGGQATWLGPGQCTADSGLQKLTLTITGPGNATSTVAFVKRRLP